MQSPQYEESGAVYLAGTENVKLQMLSMRYLEGNGVYLSGYNRAASILDSEFELVGESLSCSCMPCLCHLSGHSTLALLSEDLLHCCLDQCRRQL